MLSDARLRQSRALHVLNMAMHPVGKQANLWRIDNFGATTSMRELM